METIKKNEVVVATTIREELISYESNNSRVSDSLASKEGRYKELSANLRGVRTSKDRSDARH
jgi:tRNA splicing ligase